MSNLKTHGKTARFGIRFVAAVLATVMVLEMAPSVALAGSPADLQGLNEAIASALSDTTPPLGEETEIPGAEPEKDDVPDEEVLPPEGDDGPLEGEPLSFGEDDSHGSVDMGDAPANPEFAALAAGIIVGMNDDDARMGVQSVEVSGLKVVDASGPLRLVEVGEDKTLEEALSELNGNPAVEYAEPNYILRTQDFNWDFEEAVNDPRYIANEQWGLELLEGAYAWAVGLGVFFEEAEEGATNPYDLDGNGLLDITDDIDGLYSEAAPVTVAVIDTGVDAAHEDLIGRVLPGRNVILDNAASHDDSKNGHGTHIAGIIAANANNGKGIAGTTGEFPVQVLPVKALDSAGIGTMYDVAEAIRWAVDTGGAKIINLSLGARLFDFPKTLGDAVAHAQNRGALVIAAVGNESLYVDGFYPACLPGVVSVGATTRTITGTLARASFSNTGYDILAPGEGIVSTLPVQVNVDGYGALSGTSQASAFASGAAALMLSVFPGLTPSEVSVGLYEGQAKHYISSYSVLYILSAENALWAVYDAFQEPLVDESFEFISPADGSRVTGLVDLTVRVAEPSIVNRIEFTYYDGDGDTVIGAVYREDILLGGYATVAWDTSTLADGSYYIDAESYDDDGKSIWRDGISLDVANTQETGLVIEVVNPQGQPASGALVTVHHPYLGLPYEGAAEEVLIYQELWNDNADLSGRVMIPSSLATGGNDYLVTARGTNPAFFYWQIVRAPDTEVSLTSEGASTVTVSASRTDGSPLTGADVSVELLGVHLPHLAQPGDVIDFGESSNQTNLTPLVKLNALGQGSVTMTHGNYNIRVKSDDEVYYLCSYGAVIDQATEAVALHSQPEDVSALRFVPDPNCYSAALTFWSESDPHWGTFPQMTDGDEVIVSPGTFGGTATVIYSDAALLWAYTFSVGPVTATGGDAPIRVGESLSATMEPSLPEQSYYAGERASFAFFYGDAYGNTVSSVKSGTATYAMTNRYPEMMIQGPQGNLPTIKLYSWSGEAGWSVPSGVILGEHTIRVQAELGYFGHVESASLLFAIQNQDEAPPGPVPDFTARFYYKDSPLGWLQVYVARCVDGLYYMESDSYLEETDPRGKVELDAWSLGGGDLSVGDKIALIGYGWVRADEWQDSRLVFVVKTLTIEEFPMSVTIDVGELQKVNLHVYDRDGEEVSADDRSLPVLSMHRYGPDGIPVGITPPDQYFQNPFEVWVTEGDYLFQATQQTPPSWEVAPIYSLTEQVTVNAETPAEGLDVNLDASEAVELEVIPPQSAPPEGEETAGEYWVPAVAVFPPGVTRAPVLGLGPYPDNDSYGFVPAPLYVSPGNYHLQGVMTRGHVDGLWCYWLTPDDYITISGDTTYSWTLGDFFDGEDTTVAIAPSTKTDFGIGEAVQLGVRVEDGQGNRLVGMALNLQYLGGFVPTSADAGAQNHEEIAPFITLTGPSPDTTEVHRYKEAGANYGYLEDWDAYKGRRSARLFQGGSTFFGGEYLIPSDALGGEYTGAMELEIGPEGSIRRTVSFNVLAAHAAPRLDALSPFTNSLTVTVTGITVAGAEVTLYSSYNEGEAVPAGTATSDGNGRFSIEVSLPSEGTYEFTATSAVDQTISAFSAPVSVTIDRQAPGQVRNLEAVSLDASHVRLTWTAPAQADKDVSGIALYRIRRDGEVVANDVTPGDNLEWQDSGLLALTEYAYDVRAVDRAGNESEAVVVTVTTTAGLDSIPPTPPRNLSAILTGFRTLLQWEQASDNIGVAGYKVYRSLKGAEPPIVAEWTIEDPYAVSFDDPDYLDSGATYVYVVVAYDAALNESITEGEDANGIPAAVAEVTTRAIAFSAMQWSAPRVKGGLLDPDDDAQGKRPVLQVTAIGDTGRTAKAAVMLAGPYVNLSDDNPDNDGTFEIDLIEDMDGQGLGLGVYRGSLSIPYDTTSIVAITCTLSDAAGTSATMEGHRLPEDFAPKLRVTVESDHPGSESLKDAEIKVWSESLGSGAKTTVNGVGTYVIEDLQPAVDYVLTLTTKGKVVTARETGLVLSPGEENSVVVRPVAPATFRIRALRSAGGAAQYSSVAVTRADGTPLAQGSIYYDGWATLTYSDTNPLGAGAQIVVSVTPSQEWALTYTGVAGMRFVLGPDANEFTVTLPERQAATLSGKALTHQEPKTAIKGVSVSAYQTIEGNDRLIKRVTTDENGDYSLDLYAGPVRLVANYPRWGWSSEVRLDSPLSPDEARQYNLEVPITKAISLTVNTKRIGEPAFAMDMDWRVAVHLHVEVTNLGAPEKPKNAWAGFQGIEDGLVQIPDAEPGDRIRIEADGREGNMTKDSVEAVLDANCWARAEINLIEKGTIQARVKDVSGNAHDGILRYAELFKVEEQGTRFIETLKSDEEIVTSKALDQGTYSLVFHWDPLPSVINVEGTWVPPLESLQHLKTYLADKGVAVENLTFADDPILAAGIVKLPVPALASPGYFRGAEGNDLAPSKYDSGPGGIITMRGSYRYGGGVGLIQPKICFGIPYGAQLIEGSVVVTPEEGTLDPRVAVRPDAVELSFGSSMREAFSGIVVYRVRMPDDPDTAVCEARMWAEHRTSGRSTTEDIAVVFINVPYVSIEAPAKAWDESREMDVNGRATPFATVRVYDVNYFLAETRASESGAWKATVVLPDRGRRANHYLRAEVALVPSEGHTTGPTWPAGAEVTVSDVLSHSLTLTWPEAQDDAGVVQYIATAYLGDGSVGAVRAAFPAAGGAGNISVTFDDLDAGAGYSFKVEAADATYNWSAPLTCSATTGAPDTESPTWHGDQLWTTEVKFYSLRLHWPQATDNEEMREYTVSCSPAQGTLVRPAVVPAGTESLLVEGLTRDRHYRFTVIAKDINNKESVLSASLKTLQYDTELPVWPTGAEITTAVLDTEVTLNWPAALDNVQISNYPIFQKDPGGNWRSRYLGYGNAHTVKQLQPETTYSFRVYAQDAGANRTESPLEATVTTAARDRTPPAWSSGAQVAVSEKTQDGFLLSWPVPSDVSGVRSYKVRDSSQAQGMVHTPSTNSLRLTGLTRGETYTFMVLAQDTRGNWTPDDAGLTISVVALPDDQTPPAWPAGSRLEVPEVSSNNAELVWTPATFDIDQTGLPSYLIQAKDASGGVHFGATVGQNIRTWAVGGLQPGRTYTVSVEAIDEWGNVSTDGPKQVITTPASDTQAPRWPQDAQLEAYGMQKAREGTYTVLFSWPQALDFGLHHYEITARDRLGQAPPSSHTITQQTSWHLWGLNPAETYTVEVTAKDLSGNVSTALSTTVVTPGGLSGASVAGQSGSFGAAGMAAQSDPSPRIVSSAIAKVEYDQDAVRIESVSMRQRDGRTVDFAPVGKFAYVLVPGMPINFDVRFNKPERVTELRVLAENGAEIGGPLSGPVDPGVVLGVVGTMLGSKTIPGKIYASYATSPSPFSISDLPSFDREVEGSYMPNPWRGVGEDSAEMAEGSYEYQDDKLHVTYGYASAAQDSGHASVAATLADPRIHVGVNYTFNQILGVDPPDPTFSYSLSSDKFTFSAAVAVDSPVITGRMAGQGWLDTPKVLVKVLGDCWVSGGLNIADLFSTVSGANDLQDYELDLDGLLDGLNADCPAADMRAYREQIELEKSAAMQRTIAKCALSLGSMALGVVIPGLGFAIGSFVAGKIIEGIIDDEQEDRFNEIKNGIEMNDFCKPKKREWKKDLIADPTWILDPAGYVYEVVPENRLEGVTATALESVGGIWTQWDATWYEQDNPLATDAEGRYAWDVPTGKWKVSFEKDGYQPVESWEMDVPPPHTEVNVAMATTERPAVASVSADSEAGLDIIFDKYMRVSTVTAGTVTVTELADDGSVRTDEAGAPVRVAGATQAVGPVADPGDPDAMLARTFKFVPDFSLSIGDSYEVRISDVVESYTGLSIDGEYVATVTAEAVIAVTGVRLSRETVTLEVGASITLGAEVVPSNATDQGISWSSSNNQIATVSQNGTVNAVSVGTATITVTTNDGGYQDTCGVSVIRRDPGYDPEPIGKDDIVKSPPADVRAEETHVVGPDETTISIMEGILVLEIPAGAFSPGTQLVVRRLRDDATPSDGSLSVVASPTYEILIRGLGPAKPVTVRFMYCAVCLKGMDPRKLGVYREDESNPGNYTYIGGVVDTDDHTATLPMDGFSRYVVLGRDVTFNDIADHWGRSEIEVLASRYLVSGVNSAEFQPDRLVTRAELAKMLVGMLAHGSSSTMPAAPSSPTFADVAANAWYYVVVEAASQLGLIKGDGGIFRPNDPVTRQEMAVMLARALGEGRSTPAKASEAMPFGDIAEISDWAIDGVASAWYWGLMQGTGNNAFQPLGNATRAQAAAVVLRMLELRGLVSNLATLRGALSVSEIGGRHLEMVDEDEKVYVILPQTEPARSRLEEAAAEAASSGSVSVTVTGILSDGPNVYMRGQIVKVIKASR